MRQSQNPEHDITAQDGSKLDRPEPSAAFGLVANQKCRFQCVFLNILSKPLQSTRICSGLQRTRKVFEEVLMSQTDGTLSTMRYLQLGAVNLNRHNGRQTAESWA